MTDFDPDAVIAAMAPLLDLPLDAADQSVIATHLRIARTMAATVAAVPLPDPAEPLPVFRP
jgi:hypothetical protein